MKMSRSMVVAAGGVAIVLALGGVAYAKGQDQPVRTETDHVLPEVTGGLTPVGDSEGVVRGWVEEAGLSRISEASGRFLSSNQLELVDETEDGALVPNEAALGLSDTIMDLEAIPVFDEDGEVVGHFGAGFIELDELAARQAAARAMVDNAIS